MEDYIISVVSYKRPNNTTCKLLSETDLNWRVFIYSFDPYYDEYVEKYKNNIFTIDTFEKANLAKKRQLVLDIALLNNYKYCFMLDDDIDTIDKIIYSDKITEAISLKEALLTMLDIMKDNNKYVALSASYNISDDISDIIIEDYKNICNNSVFNLDIYKQHTNIRYNEISKCEDMEFTMDLILNGCITGRVKHLLMHNTLQGGTTNDGLSYRFKNTNRFIEEGSYMKNKYEDYSEVFEFSENHFKMNTNKLITLLKEKNI